MARNDRQFQPLGNVATPASWVLPPQLEIVPKAITAVYDGTSAGAAFLPTLEIVSDSGQLVARVPADTAVAAGGSAEVTFAPFLRAQSTGSGTGAFVGARIEKLMAIPIGQDPPRVMHYDNVAFNVGCTVDLLVNDSKITFVTAGYYECTFTVDWEPNTTGRRLSVITKNGDFAAGTGSNFAAQETQAVSDAGATTILCCTGVDVFAAGDYITSGIAQDSGGALSPGGNRLTFMSASLIGT